MAVAHILTNEHAQLFKSSSTSGGLHVAASEDAVSPVLRILQTA